MAKETIMLVCSAGMSTSLLVTKMEKAAEEKVLMPTSSQFQHLKQTIFWKKKC